MAALAAKDIVKRLAKRRILILLVLAVLACFGGIINEGVSQCSAK